MQSHGSCPSDPSAAPDGLEQQFDLLRIDYERTLGLAEGVTGGRVTMRGIVATAYLAFLGLGIDNKSWALCAAAAAAALLFAFQDAREHWIYHQLVRRANRIERLFQHRMQALDLPYDPYPSRRLRAELEGYEFGALGQIRRFRLTLLRETLSRTAVVLYCLPIALGIVAALVV